MKTSKILIHGEIGYEITSTDVAKLLDLAAGNDLDVHVASPGGFVFDGIEIFNAFRDYKKQFPKAQLMLTIKGLAASMASYLAVCPAFDLVAAEDNAVFMIHNAYGGASGDYRDMKKAAEIFEGISNVIAVAYAQKTKKPLADVKKMMDDETWFFGSEIKDAGFIDEIITTPDKGDRLAALGKAQLAYNKLSAKLKDKPMDTYKLAAMLKPKAAGSTKVNPEPEPEGDHEAHTHPIEEFDIDTLMSVDNTDEGHKYLAPGVKIVIGKLKEKTKDAAGKPVCTVKSQKFTFASARFTAEQALDYCAKNDIKYISFQPYQEGTNTAASKTSVKPRNAGNNTGGHSMTLNEFLASDPAAKFEHDEMIRAAEKAGHDKCKAESEGRIAKATAILNATDKSYPQAVKNVALEVMAGTKSVETLDAIVANADMFAEMIKSQAAEKEQPGYTPAQMTQPKVQGMPKTEEDFQAMLAKAKAETGVK